MQLFQGWPHVGVELPGLRVGVVSVKGVKERLEGGGWRWLAECLFKRAVHELPPPVALAIWGRGRGLAVLLGLVPGVAEGLIQNGGISPHVEAGSDLGVGKADGLLDLYEGAGCIKEKMPGVHWVDGQQKTAARTQGTGGWVLGG